MSIYEISMVLYWIIIDYKWVFWIDIPEYCTTDWIYTEETSRMYRSYERTFLALCSLFKIFLVSFSFRMFFSIFFLLGSHSLGQTHIVREFFEWKNKINKGYKVCARGKRQILFQTDSDRFSIIVWLENQIYLWIKII